MNKEQTQEKHNMCNMKEDFWVCGTHQSICLMRAWLCNSKRNVRYIIPSKHRYSLRIEAIRMMGNSAEQTSIVRFWLYVLRIVLKKSGDCTVFLPHTSPHLFSGRISRFLMKSVMSLVPEVNIRFYDEGLSLLHVLSETEGYAKEAALAKIPMICLPHQKVFYKALFVEEGEAKEGILQMCEDRGSNSIEWENSKSLKGGQNVTHLISSRYLDYEKAYKLTRGLKEFTHRQIYYPHPNRKKDPEYLPDYFMTFTSRNSVEISLEKNLMRGDYIIVGFTGLTGYLMWIDISKNLGLNIAVMVKKGSLERGQCCNTLVEKFVMCAKTVKTRCDRLIIEDKSTTCIVYGDFPSAIIAQLGNSEI